MNLTPLQMLATPWHSFRGGASGAWMLHPNPVAALDPFMMVDHFIMSEAVFAPHPHAGFSAVTYLWADSAGAVANRDSLGHAMTVQPGGLLWTQAGSGVMHEEVPAVSGQATHGLQIFVNSAAAKKGAPPRVFRRAPAEVALWQPSPGVLVRVVLGRAGGHEAAFDNDTPITLLELRMAADAKLALPLTPGHRALIVVAEGGFSGAEQSLNQIPGQAHALLPQLPPDGQLHLQAGAQGAYAVLLAGRPIGEPVVSHGPFIGTHAAEITEMIRRYQSGAMGRLEPTPAPALA
jgi:redox-sensitive bicupin YhaK (pirin superfamily)